MAKYGTISKVTKEELEKLCRESYSYREVTRKLGYIGEGGSCIASIKKAIHKYNVDISHFKHQHSNMGKIIGYKYPIEDYLSNSRYIQSHKLRIRLIESHIFQEKCMCCNNTRWLDNKIPLELHHKDGNKNNNNLDNLELLCPNCHTFTKTYKQRNRKSKTNKKTLK